MKKHWKRGLAAVCVWGMVCTQVAFAQTEDKTAGVLLDGQAITFQDTAAPILYSGRTYVPFRAIFEAMGATVGYDGVTKTVTASRDDTTVSFPVGQAEVTVTTDGVVRKVKTDAASFARDGVTYVPVRFAAQAFGAAVGWDAQNTAVVIADVKKVQTQYKDSFSRMNQYLSLIAPTGTQGLEVDMGLQLTLQTAYGEIAVPIGGKVIGDWNRYGVNVAFSVSADVSALDQLLAEHADAVGQKQAAFLRSLQDAYFTCIINRLDNTVYLKGLPLATLGVPEGKFVAVPLDDVTQALSGGALNLGILDGCMQTDFSQCVAGFAAAQPLKEQADAARIQTIFAAAERLYGDRAFVQEDGQSVLAREYRIGDAVQSFSLNLPDTSPRSATVVWKQSDTTGTAEMKMVQTENGACHLEANLSSTAYRADLKLDILQTPKEGTILLTPQE